MPTVYLPISQEINTEAIAELKKHTTVIMDNETVDKSSVDALFVRTQPPITSEFMKEYPLLKYILRAGVGIDHIDQEYCKKNNITIINAPASNANAVAEFSIGLMIMSLRFQNVHTTKLRSGGWRDSHNLGYEIHNKTIGLVGCGAIARLVAKKLSSFSPNKILGYDPFVQQDVLQTVQIEKAELHTVISQSDIISMHVPYLPETKHLINKNIFQSMKKTAFIINTARGEIIEESALIEALTTKRIAGAAIDVFENEPEVNKKLLDIPTLIATPHIAGYTKEADYEMAKIPVQEYIKTLNV